MIRILFLLALSVLVSNAQLVSGSLVSGQVFTGTTNTGVPATFSDDFNRADANPFSDPLGAYTVGPGAMEPMKILSSRAEATIYPSACRVDTPTFAANHSSQFSMTAGALGVGPCVRMQPGASGDCYLAYADNTTTITIYKGVDTGTMAFNALGAAFTVTTIVDTDIIKLSVTGSATTTLELWINNVSQGTRDDSTSPYTSGQPGFLANTFGYFDNFQANDL